MSFISEFNSLISSTSSSDSESTSEFDQATTQSEMSHSLDHSIDYNSGVGGHSTSPMISYHGQIRSLYDALLLIEAARLNKLPTIKRRLTTFERQKSIKPDNIFIWNERTSNIRRWTDGKFWSDSKLFNNHFLIYHEKVNSSNSKDKANRLVKQSLSLTTRNNEKYHLIYYFKRDQLQSLRNDRRRKKKNWFNNHTEEEEMAQAMDMDIDTDISSQSDDDGYSVSVHHGLHGKIPSKDPLFKDLTITDDVYPINFLKDVSLYSMKGSSSSTNVIISDHSHHHSSNSSSLTNSASSSTTSSGAPSLVSTNFSRTPITTISSPRTSVGSLISLKDSVSSSSNTITRTTMFNQAIPNSPATSTSIMTDGKHILPPPVTTFRSNYFDDRINSNDALALLMLDKCFA
ncbi:Gti1/Pac2 family-domain-containing protein [Scheffersomyces coipomensis]|uniref:Gti1/Pac2 family-domain-containing protein n=1 Tax=Scheffersomyces coipomensis TaxID=1788519 RepID=UPI00315C510D